MTFETHPNFKEKIFILDLPLCRVFLENEKHYPWLILVPRRTGVSRMMELSLQDQLLLMQEMHIAQTVLWNNFQPKQLNVAAIGNKTPQLHIHIIARYQEDPAWPSTVWDHPIRKTYKESEKLALIEKIKKLFEHPQI